MMRGVNLQFGFNLLSKMDDIIFSIIQYYEEMQKKNAKSDAKKVDDIEKMNEKQQRHVLHILSIILKTKMNAKFELDYVDSFQNNLLSLLGEGDI